MIIIGVDYHPSFQQIAHMDQETGDCGERRLNHSDGETERFYQLCVLQTSGLLARRITSLKGQLFSGGADYFILSLARQQAENRHGHHDEKDDSEQPVQPFFARVIYPETQQRGKQ